MENAWYNGIPYEDAMYLLYWNHYRHLEAILEAKGASDIVRRHYLKSFKIWQFPKVLRNVERWKRVLIKPLVSSSPVSPEEPILNWCLHNKIPKGRRHDILLKNLAALLHSMPLTIDEKKDVYAKIIQNCPNMTSTNKGWLKWFQLQSKAEYNKVEVNQWLKMHNLSHLCYKETHN